MLETETGLQLDLVFNAECKKKGGKISDLTEFILQI